VSSGKSYGQENTGTFCADRQTDTTPSPACSATTVTLLTFSLGGERTVLPPELMALHNQRGKGIAEESQRLFKHHFTKKYGGRVATSVYS
jgi:hypothetical protein